ncbi:MAG: putative iron-only hydrogenase system regulator [Firmicutes bacterium]|nr:putative iron-only hydrogenase system regulator [Bacillota bacterium]
MPKRIGVIGIVVDDPKVNGEKANAIISEFSHLIIGRMGIPRKETQVGVIALIIEGTTDAVGAFTGKLGRIPGVNVKSALTAKSICEEENP